MMLGALIGVAGSLIGGAMQNKAAKNAAKQERAWAVQDQAEQFVRLRAAAEKAGFNPLTALGAAPNSGMVNPTSAASQNYMGEAIATSSLMLADSLAKTKAAATGKRLENANRANADLTRKLNAATLRPKMGGVFTRPSKFGIGANGQTNQSSSDVLAGRDGSNAAGNANDLFRLEPLPQVEPLDPRRKVQDQPVTTTPGFMVVDNRYFGRAYIPSLDGEEALHWYDYPDLIAPAAQWAWNRYVPWYADQMRMAANRQRERPNSRFESPQKPQGFRAQHLGAR